MIGRDILSGRDYPLEGPGEFLMENPQDWLRLRNLADEAEIE